MIEAPEQTQEQDVLTPDEQQAAEELALAARLEAFGTALAKTRDKWVMHRRASGVDKRWREDNDQYDGRDESTRMTSSMMDAVEQGYPVTNKGTQPTRSTVNIGITRQKTNANEARLADILLPTDDRNWGIKPQHMPHLAPMLQSDEAATEIMDGVDPDDLSAKGVQPSPAPGQPMTQNGQPIAKKQLAHLVQEICRYKANRMQDLIDQQLNTCDYNGELRKVLHDAAVLGIGVLKGPIVMNRRRKAWKKQMAQGGVGVYMSIEVDELAPASYRVDPRFFYWDPSCGEDIHKGAGVFEHDTLTPKEVRRLRRQPGYLESQLRKVIEEGPKRTAALMGDERHNEDSLLDSETYDYWEYHGEVEIKDLRAAGVDVKDQDPLDSVSACVIMINNTVVKAYLNPLDDGEVPYDTFVWERVAGSVAGYGVPRLMRAQARVLNAAWRMMMDNAGTSAGQQIVINRKLITPADGVWNITARKIWLCNEDGVDVRSAMTTFTFDSQQQQLENIIELALKFTDEETSQPMLAQGEKGTAPETLGGMQILMNSSNVVLRRLVKQFDDMITRRHIRRYYDYNMLHSDDDSVKGDFNVDARGTSALLVKDVQSQAYLQLLAAGQNPTYAQYLDTLKLFKAALRAQYIDPEEICKSDDQIAQEAEQRAQQPQQQDPKIQAALIRAQAEQAKAQADAQRDIQTAEIDRAAKLEQLKLENENLMLQLSVKQNISLQQIKAELAKTVLQSGVQHDTQMAQTFLAHHAKSAQLAHDQQQAHLDRAHEAQQNIINAAEPQPETDESPFGDGE